MNTIPTGPGWEISWGEGLNEKATSTASLERALDRLTQEAVSRPFVVVIESISGRSLLIGLGRDQTVLQYQASPNPPYYASLGDGSVSGVEVFDFGGQETEFERRHLVPMAAGRRAVEEFAVRDERPANLRWERV